MATQKEVNKYIDGLIKNGVTDIYEVGMKVSSKFNISDIYEVTKLVEKQMMTGRYK